MLPQAPPITFSFATEESTLCGSLPTTTPLTDAQRLKAIESYPLISASHAVSTKRTRQDGEMPTTRNKPSHVYMRNSAPSNLSRLSSANSEKPQMPQGQKNTTSLRLALRLQDTFRHYLRLRVPNQINHPPHTERHRPSQELRRMFSIHDSAYCQS